MEYFLYFSTSFLQSYGVLIYRLARSGDDSQPDLPAYSRELFYLYKSII